MASDQPENFAAAAASTTTPQAEKPQDLAAMFDEVAPEDFGGAEYAPEEPKQPEAPRQPPAAQQERFTGYAPNIEAKKRELAALREKLAGFRTTETYVVTDEVGNRNYNFAAFYADQARADAIKDDIDDLKERARDRREAGREQEGTALQLARVVLNERLGRSRMPKEMKDLIVKLYRQGFDSLSRDGWWTSPQLADRSKLKAAIEQLLDTVVGRVAQQQYIAPAHASDAPGFDAVTGGGEQPPAPPADDDDEFTKAVMEAHSRVRGDGRFQTIGDKRRAERQRRMNGGS